MRGGFRLAVEGEGDVEWFEGDFEDCEADTIRRLGPDAVEPKRIRYKKFARGTGRVGFIYRNASLSRGSLYFLIRLKGSSRP